MAEPEEQVATATSEASPEPMVSVLAKPAKRRQKMRSRRRAEKS
jgi:hypothetical protein